MLDFRKVLLQKKIMDHLLSNNLLPDSQCGFLPGRSTCTQLLVALNKWYDSYVSGVNIHFVYTDISKAFDTTSHTKLFSVLKSYGIGNNTFNWIHALITNKCQCICINNALSFFYQSLVVFCKAVCLDLFCFLSLLII